LVTQRERACYIDGYLYEQDPDIVRHGSQLASQVLQCWQHFSTLFLAWSRVTFVVGPCPRSCWHPNILLMAHHGFWPGHPWFYFEGWLTELF
jgi:hypothetical protein